MRKYFGNTITFEVLLNVESFRNAIKCEI
jgi:hypothetical protein